MPLQGLQDPSEVADTAVNEANTLANRVRWMLRETMGADGDLERRQAELSVGSGNLPPVRSPFDKRV